jgi:hypothetical protein
MKHGSLQDLENAATAAGNRPPPEGQSVVQGLLDVVCHLDGISNENHAANYVLVGAVMSLLVERLGLSLDDIEAKIELILKSSAESHFINTPTCAARCKTIIDILRVPPPSTVRN